ncbi:MAG: ABC transporter ATP-binding protein [Ruminococcaceae bacterium]|nr:ABC transporter ATP-binding protein [Oscillospiraceae bacterium]
MKQYFKYIKPHILFFIFGPIFMITEVVGEVLMPKLISVIIDSGVSKGDLSSVTATGIMMIFVAVMMMAGGVLGNYFAVRASVGFATNLRSDLFKKVQKFSFKNIDEFSTGSLVTRLTNDITQMQNVIRMSLVMLLRAPGMLIGALIMAISINRSLATVIAIVIPILATAIITIMVKAFPRFNIMQKKLDKVNSDIQENLTNVRVVKSFVRTDYENEKFSKSNRDLRDSTLRAMYLVIKNGPVMTLMMNITTLAVVWMGGNFIIKGSMEVGELTAFTTYIVQILMSLMMVSMIILNASRALASSKRIKEVLNAKSDITDDNAKEKDKKIEKGIVEFKNVSFSYNPSSSLKILDGISFCVNSGETLGIIGATGSGKTSLVQLIPRLYDVTDGEILIDGTDVRDYSLYNLREGVAMVLQKNTLFSGTIEENLRWGKEDATDEELTRFTTYAQAHSFITSFKDGYETELGQGGVNVSGGQKQRLCIARALIKNPKILILDDSTSAVDTATETRIRESFSNDLRDTTKIIIAQRITSVMDADKILVIDDGKIVGEGTHRELLETNSHYQEIYYSQKDKEANA